MLTNEVEAAYKPPYEAPWLDLNLKDLKFSLSDEFAKQFLYHTMLIYHWHILFVKL